MIRLLDLNHVSYLHSQTIYHAVAYCTTTTSPGTVAVLSPQEPYISIGYHQSLEREIDVAYCHRKGIPIIRREVGGGAVYLDNDQLFFQCVFPKHKVPLKIENFYRLFLKPAVNTYRRLGIDAYHSQGNDIQVGEKKICGTGAGRIEDAMVVVGNIIFDFNYTEMVRALRVPSPDFRKKVHDSMNIYLTTLRRELGYIPDRQQVKKILIEEFENVLGYPLQVGNLSSDEEGMRSRLDEKFTHPDWLYEKGGKINNGVKINSDVWVRQAICPFSGGSLEIILRLKADTIDDIIIASDVSSQTLSALKPLERHLVGQPLNHDPLLRILKSFYSQRDIGPPGLEPQDMVRAILGVKN